MKIIIKSNPEAEQAKITIDTSGLQYSNSIRNALVLAMELDGHSSDLISEVFNIDQDAKKSVH